MSTPTTTPPAGWHPDPHNSGQDRYWDGRDWTDQRRASAVAPAASPSPSLAGAASTRPREFWIAVGGVAVIFVGLLGSWAKVLGALSVSGLDTDDGKLLAVIAAGAAACLVRFGATGGRRAIAGAGVLGVIACALAVYEIVNLSGQELLTVGWGLYVDVIAAAVLTGACAKLWLPARRVGGAH